MSIVWATEPVTCNARTSWLLTSGTTGPTAGEGQVWKQSKTGPEEATRADLLKACQAAVAKPDSEGWIQSDVQPCVITCDIPTLMLSVVAGDFALRRVAKTSLPRLESTAKRCSAEAEKAGEPVAPPLSFSGIVTDGALALEPIPGHPLLTECLAPKVKLIPPGEDSRGVTWRLSTRNVATP